jgi:hypothetical protein
MTDILLGDQNFIAMSPLLIKTIPLFGYQEHPERFTEV